MNRDIRESPWPPTLILRVHSAGERGSWFAVFQSCAAMNCRIERLVSEEGSAVLRVSGRLSGHHVGTLGGLLQQETRAVAIDLEDVRLVDREAVRFLAFSELHGTELKHCPAYIREWITREKASAKRAGG